MKYHMFSVYDRAVMAYLPPFYLRSVGEAMRMMEDTTADPEHRFSQHPADFRLVRLGTFEDGQAEFELLDHPEIICTAEETILHRMRAGQEKENQE